MEKENSNPPLDHQSKEEAIIHHPMATDIVEAETIIQDVASTLADAMETGTKNAIFLDKLATNKENSNPLSKETEEAVIRSLPTPKSVDTSKEGAIVRDGASTSADTVETDEEYAMTFPFWDEADEDDYQIQTENLTAAPPRDVAPVVNPRREFLMAPAPAPARMAAVFRINAFNIFNVGARVNPCNNQLAAEERTEASATARLSAPVVNSTIFEGTTEEEDGNDWYESIARDAQRLEQMEESEIQEMSPPLRLAESPPKENDEHCSQKRPSDVEDGHELTLEDYCKIWGLHSSELDPDEPGSSSTKRQSSRVPPLDDDEVAKFDCGICLETLPILDLFHGMQCDHNFCAHCMATYIEGSIRDGVLPILCPDPACKEAAGEGNNDGVLNPEHCKKSIDFAAFCTWSDRLTENVIPQDQRVYCPNPRCGLMLERTLGDNEQAPCKAPCPACNHLMCTVCGLGWVMDGRDDDDHNCEEGKGAALVKELAAAHSWKQCPSCKIMVEKIMGCNTMHCRCGCLFCYSCGRPMDAGRNEGAELCQCRYNVAHVRPQLRARAIINRLN